MNYRCLKTASAVLCISLFTATAAADEDRMAQLEQRLTEAQARLNLTDEQLEQVAPTLEKSFTSTQAILQKYGVDPDSRNNGKKLGLKKARQLKQELEVVRFNTLAELDDVLTDQQLLEYQKIQAEHKEELKQRVFDRRQANQGSQRRGKAVRSIN